ncbi:hypothetical protein J4G63_15385 [Aeromonas sobria]|uniref:Uncharacterized protein n=1 Tax=Aeromonas sobria TaxID=646 RepID=A0A1S2CXN7_AERSO|nr:hypothetical protein [Aeromonas sobria]MBS4688617.1 hypothetical protein [Aeromonas sobria]OHY92441.1 hypothetical protein BJD16_13215 [Aeromonas sobria]
MKRLFHPVSEQEALTELPRLQQRLTAKARPSSFIYRRSEGKSLLVQAQQSLRWHQLFHHLNRRICP